MIKFASIRNRLTGTSTRYAALQNTFTNFALLIEAKIPASYGELGIVIKPRNEYGFFTATFAGHTLFFVFTTSSLNELLQGRVNCYLQRDFPDTARILIGGFTFKPNGETDLKDADNDDMMDISTGFGAIAVTLHFIDLAMSK